MLASVFCLCSQVKAALEAAEPYKAELQRRGVLVIPLPIYDSQGAEAAVELITPPTAEELRWRVTPVQLENWKAWCVEKENCTRAYMGRPMDV